MIEEFIKYIEHLSKIEIFIAVVALASAGVYFTLSAFRVYKKRDKRGLVLALTSAYAYVFLALALALASASAFASALASTSASALAFALAFAFASSFFLLYLTAQRPSSSALQTTQENLRDQLGDSTERANKLRFQIVQEKDDEKREALEEQEQQLTAEIDRLKSQIRKMQSSLLIDTDGKFDVPDAKHMLAIAHNRLSEMQDSLRTRSVESLKRGINFSLFGFFVILLAAIFFTFFGSSIPWSTRMVQYLPFLTGGVVLQVVGVFFLRTYRSIETDISQNKNEITNIELRLTAILLADQKQKHEIVTRLLHEERNFILKKGETVAKDDQYISVDSVKTLLSTLKDAVQTK